jgi:hypothetical protein
LVRFFVDPLQGLGPQITIVRDDARGVLARRHKVEKRRAELQEIEDSLDRLIETHEIEVDNEIRARRLLAKLAKVDQDKTG